MYPAKFSQLKSRSMPPLPPATMVIDMRGEGEDIISMLATEIRNLTEEMKRQDINFWSSLANFVSFIALDPIDDEESESDQPAQDDFTSSLDGNTAEISSPDTSSFESILDQAGWLQSHFPLESLKEPEEDLPEEELPHPNFVELPHKIDLLRNARIKANSNLGKDDIPRYRLNEEVARIFFLADASNPNSLFSIASCAMYLKEYYRKFERKHGQYPVQSLINISVLCLNHEGTDRDTPPKDLIEGLGGEHGWNHLDTLILVEKYQRNMALMDTETQNLFAEHLLYVLLTVSPLLSQQPPNLDMLAGYENLLESSSQQRIYLPPNTYVVGLSSIEHSTRWGYRLLNFGLAEKTLQVLRESSLEDARNERLLAKHWLRELRNKVRGTLSESLPAHIPAIAALSVAMKIGSPAGGVFSRAHWDLKQGERSVTELEQYVSKVETTYSNETKGNASQQSQTRFDGPSRLPTLEDATLSIPKIWDILNQWDGEDPTMPLVSAQVAAYQVLAHPDLFHGPRGAIPVAKQQLKELADAIVEYEGTRQKGPIDVEARKKELQQLGRDEINDLKKHVRRWPLLTGFLKLKMPVAGVTMALSLLLCFIVAVFSSAWLNQLVAHIFPSAGLLLNAPLFGFPALTWFHMVFVLILAALVGIVLSFFGRMLFEPQRSAFSIEIISGLVLASVAFFGLITWLSYASFTLPAAATMILWYPAPLLLAISTITFLLVLAIIIAEYIFYFLWWKHEMKRKRAAIVETIRNKHQENIEAVTAYIVDTLTLRLLHRAGLVPNQTGNSLYSRRIEELDSLLINTHSYVEDEYRLADNRLSYEAAENSPYTREELLNVVGLKNGYWRWREAIDNNLNELKAFSVMLLQSMGEERPGTIERQFREMTASSNAEPHYVQTLTGMLTTVALRLSTATPSVDMLSSLVKRYEELDQRIFEYYNAPRFLIEAINKKMKVNSQASTQDVPLAASVLTIWGQMIWEKKDPQLRNLLTPGSVISKLIDDNLDPQTVVDELCMRATPSGRSFISGLHGGLYLFVSPSPESREFLKNITLVSNITPFPDPECLLMLYMQYFRANPLVR